MLRMILDFDGTEAEAQNVIASATQALPDVLYSVDPAGGAYGQGVEITVQSSNAEELQQVAQAVYNSDEDFMYMLC